MVLESLRDAIEQGAGGGWSQMAGLHDRTGRRRRLDPGDDPVMNLRDKVLVPPIEGPQKLGLRAIPFVEREPVEANAVRAGAVVQFRGDVALSSVLKDST